MEWLVENATFVLSAVGVILAMLYVASRGKEEALKKAAEVWALVVGLAADVLGSIPESEFEDWAVMIYEAMPTFLRLFVDVHMIKKTLLEWRRKLVEELGSGTVKAADASVMLASLRGQVGLYLFDK